MEGSRRRRLVLISGPKSSERTNEEKDSEEEQREHEGGEHVVSVVRHDRKFERGSPSWCPGNRKRPNARHEPRPARRKAARKKERAREDIKGKPTAT